MALACPSAMSVLLCSLYLGWHFGEVQNLYVGIEINRCGNKYPQRNLVFWNKFSRSESSKLQREQDDRIQVVGSTN